jgi:hypothetical protein
MGTFAVTRVQQAQAAPDEYRGPARNWGTERKKRGGRHGCQRMDMIKVENLVKAFGPKLAVVHG